MRIINLRSVDPSSDFKEICPLYSIGQEWPETESSLRLKFQKKRDRILCLSVADDEKGQMLGFNWAQSNRNDSLSARVWVIVKPEHRLQGAGGLLYEELERKARDAGILRLKASALDNEPDSLSFMLRRGFFQTGHDARLTLSLDGFDVRSLEGEARMLEGKGFTFTSMEQLGNTPEAQHKLYLLNNSTSMERDLPEGTHFWASFEEFKRDVSDSVWYLPAGQLVAIDAGSGEWAAMSAITRFPDHAFNLHTGVKRGYRGLGLACVMLAKAALFARGYLGVSHVNSEENALHEDSLEIYRELGYQMIPGILHLEKLIAQ